VTVNLVVLFTAGRVSPGCALLAGDARAGWCRQWTAQKIIFVTAQCSVVESTELHAARADVPTLSVPNVNKAHAVVNAKDDHRIRSLRLGVLQYDILVCQSGLVEKYPKTNKFRQYLDQSSKVGLLTDKISRFGCNGSASGGVLQIGRR
jgi:hypothetical protein